MSTLKGVSGAWSLLSFVPRAILLLPAAEGSAVRATIRGNALDSIIVDLIVVSKPNVSTTTRFWQAVALRSEHYGAKKR